MTYSKYRAVKTVVDNITFASKKEAARYQELKLLEKAGEIEDLILQLRYNFDIKGISLGFYKADFSYWDVSKQERITEDTKGFRTPIYRLKKKLMKALHGIDIHET